MKAAGAWLSAAVAAMVINVWGVVAVADVSGSFALDAALFPEGTQTEAVKMKVDVQSNLILNVTLSGLAFGVDAGFGSSGAEFSILSLRAVLGPLVLFDQLVFAAPFFNTGGSLAATAPELSLTQNHRAQPNGLAFVKARLGLDFNVAGFVISNLAILEDVDFPNPFLYTNPSYFVGGLDALVDVGNTGAVNQTPSVGFGDLITLTGQTKSGVALTGATGICIQTQFNVIKKRSWPESVNPACVGRPLAFSFETLSLNGLMLGGLTLDAALTWTPKQPLQAEFALSTVLAGALDALLVLRSDNVPGLNLSQLSLDLTLETLKLRLLDFEGDLAPDRLFVTFSTTLNANQNPATLTVLATFSRNEGLVFFEPVLGLTRGVATLTTSTTFDHSGGGIGVRWRASKFNVSVRSDVAVVSLRTGVEALGLQDVTIGLSSDF